MLGEDKVKEVAETRRVAALGSNYGVDGCEREKLEPISGPLEQQICHEITEGSYHYCVILW